MDDMRPRLIAGHPRVVRVVPILAAFHRPVLIL
jgi:hypothetical protein